MVFGKFKSTNSGEKINPPPRPTMVRMREAEKIIVRSSISGIKIFLLFGSSLDMVIKRVQEFKGPRGQVFFLSIE
jgi:hypothetical protein